VHTHHEILIKADSKEEAILAVEDAIAPYDGDAWDWYAIGGRWSGSHAKVKSGEWPEERDQYREGGYEDDAICYEDDPELFKDCIENQLKAQREDMYRSISRISIKNRLRLLLGKVKTSHDGEDGMLGYYLYSIAKHMAGYYNFSSFFYNAAWGGPDMPSKMWEEIEAEPSQWWLVTVDLHN